MEMSLAMDGRDGNVIGHGCRDGNVIGHGWPEWKCHWPPMAGMKMSLATDGRDGNVIGHGWPGWKRVTT